MLSNYIYEGKSVDFKNAGASDIAYHDVVPIGTGRIGVAQSSIPIGSTGTLAVTGVFEFDAINTVAFSVGDALYWDNTAKKITNVSASNVAAGWCVEAKISAGVTAKIKIG
jgi:predicted RecA/RadA family phage recombinase